MPKSSSLGQSHVSATAEAWPYRVLYVMWEFGGGGGGV